LQTYASDHEGNFPGELIDLHPDYIDDKLQFEGYIYFSGQTDTADSGSPLIVSPLALNHRRVVGYVGGHVAKIREEEYQILANGHKKSGDDKPAENEEVRKVKWLVIACHAYASDWDDGKFPDTLQVLFPDYLDDEKLFETNAGESGQMESYIYFPSLTNTSNSDLPLIASPIVSDGKRVVGFVGGYVIRMNEEDYQSLIKVQKSDQ
jgi:hypothetical protein